MGLEIHQQMRMTMDKFKRGKHFVPILCYMFLENGCKIKIVHLRFYYNTNENVIAFTLFITDHLFENTKLNIFFYKNAISFTIPRLCP